jgi:predicted exporter
MEELTDTPFKSMDDVWFTEDGVERAALVTGVLDDGFEYEVVVGNRATTAHLTQLRER